MLSRDANIRTLRMYIRASIVLTRELTDLDHEDLYRESRVCNAHANATRGKRNKREKEKKKKRRTRNYQPGRSLILRRRRRLPTTEFIVSLSIARAQSGRKRRGEERASSLGGTRAITKSAIK